MEVCDMAVTRLATSALEFASGDSESYESTALLTLFRREGPGKGDGTDTDDEDDAGGKGERTGEGVGDLAKSPASTFLGPPRRKKFFRASSNLFRPLKR